MASNTVENKVDAPNNKVTNDASRETLTLHAKLTQDFLTPSQATTIERVPPPTAILHDFQITNASTGSEVAAATRAAATSLAGAEEGAFGKALESVTVPKARTIFQSAANFASNEWADLKAGASAAEKVAPQVMKGALNELTQHPGQVAADVALGVIAGVAISALTPEATVVVGVAAAGYMGWELAKNAGGWLQDAKVVANPQKFSKSDLTNADEHLQAAGAAGTEMAASALSGGLTTGYLSGSDSEAFSALHSITAEFTQNETGLFADVPALISAGLQHVTRESRRPAQR